MNTTEEILKLREMITKKKFLGPTSGVLPVCIQTATYSVTENFAENKKNCSLGDTVLKTNFNMK